MKQGSLLRLLMLMLLHFNILAEKTYPICFAHKDETSVPGSNINTIYIPFQLAGRLMVVEARAGNIKGKFIVDTGSERLLLNAHHFPHLRGDKVESIGNTGGVENVFIKTIDTVHLDQLKIIHLRAHILDLSHIEKSKKTSIIGILGYEVFREFELLIDFPNKRIVLNRLSRRGLAIQPLMPTEIPVDSLDFDLVKHMIVLKGAVNGSALRFILDSGAELNLLDRSAGKKVLLHFTIINRVKMIGANQLPIEVLAGTLNKVSCGKQSCGEMRTLITSLDEMNAMLGTSVQGVLGYEFLYNRRVLINYRKEKIYFYPVDIKDVVEIP